MNTVPKIRETYGKLMARLDGRTGELSAKDMAEISAGFKFLAKDFPPAIGKLTAIEQLRGIKSSAAQARYLQAVMTGHPVLLREMGVLVLAHDPGSNMGAGLLRRAAAGNDWISASLILREACRGHDMATKPELLNLASRLSDATPFKAEITQGIQSLPDYSAQLGGEAFSKEKCLAALAAAMSPAKTLHSKALNSDPAVTSLYNVLRPIECDYLIAMSCTLMQPSKVVDAEKAGAEMAGYRTSDGCVLTPALLDIPLISIVRKLSAAAGVRPCNGEFLSLLRYKPGQEYRPHHDYLEEDAHDYSKVKACGQRKATLLTYLNDGYEGGETAFPELDITYNGNTGDSLYFENTDAKGAPYPKSLHAGMPVKSGEKWLATLWCREKPFWPWMTNPAGELEY